MSNSHKMGDFSSTGYQAVLNEVFRVIGECSAVNPSPLNVIERYMILH